MALLVQSPSIVLPKHAQVCPSNTPLCWYQFVLVRVSIAAKKHHNQKESWGGKGLFGLYFNIAVITEEFRTGTQTGQDPGGRS